MKNILSVTWLWVPKNYTMSEKTKYQYLQRPEFKIGKAMRKSQTGVYIFRLRINMRLGMMGIMIGRMVV